MSFDPEPTLRAIVTLLEGLRANDRPRFSRVLIGPRPTKVLPAGYTAVVAMDHIEVATVFLNATTELHTVVIRIYRAISERGEENEELTLASVIPAILDALKGGYTLSSSIRAVDFGGIHGERPRVDFGDEEIARKPYWTAHLYVPCIVDVDAVGFTP